MAQSDEKFLSNFKPWYLDACQKQPRLLKWKMRAWLLFFFILLGPLESVWNFIKELRRAYRNFSMHKVFKPWREFGEHWRLQATEIQKIRAAQAKGED